jgi:hypothetical protein
LAGIGLVRPSRILPMPGVRQATTGALARLEARLAEICGWSSGRGP